MDTVLSNDLCPLDVIECICTEQFRMPVTSIITALLKRIAIVTRVLFVAEWFSE